MFLDITLVLSFQDFVVPVDGPGMDRIPRRTGQDRTGTSTWTGQDRTSTSTWGPTGYQQSRLNSQMSSNRLEDASHPAIYLGWIVEHCRVFLVPCTKWLVYATVHMYSWQVILEKLPEKHGHVELVTLYVNQSFIRSVFMGSLEIIWIL